MLRPSGLRLARAVALRWPGHAVPPCVVPGAVVLRLVAMAVPPCVVLVAMSQFAAAMAGRIMAAGMVRGLWLPVLRWELRRVPQPNSSGRCRARY